MKCILILPDTWAKTSWSLGNSTRNIPFGRASLTLASTSIACFFAINPLYMRISTCPGVFPESGAGPGIPSPMLPVNGQNLRPVLSYGYRMFKVGRELAIGSNHCPLVIQYFGVPVSHVEHGLYCDAHSNP